MSGWLATAATVAVYDLWAVLSGRATMSAAFWHWLDHPRGRVVCVIVWSGLTAHLFFVRWPR